jgi:hypothetical protein
MVVCVSHLHYFLWSILVATNIDVCGHILVLGTSIQVASNMNQREYFIYLWTNHTLAKYLYSAKGLHNIIMFVFTFDEILNYHFLCNSEKKACIGFRHSWVLPNTHSSPPINLNVKLWWWRQFDHSIDGEINKCCIMSPLCQYSNGFFLLLLFQEAKMLLKLRVMQMMVSIYWFVKLWGKSSLAPHPHHDN